MRELALEEEASLGGFGHREHLGELQQFFDVGVGDVGRTFGVLVVDFDGNDAVLAGDDFGDAFQRLARAGKVLGLVKFHEIEALDQVVRHRAALEHGDVDFVGVLEGSGRSASQSREAGELGQERRSRGLALLRRQNLRGGGEYVGRQQGESRDHDRKQKRKPEDQLLVPGENDEQVEQAVLDVGRGQARSLSRVLPGIFGTRLLGHGDLS